MAIRNDFEMLIVDSLLTLLEASSRVQIAIVHSSFNLSLQLLPYCVTLRLIHRLLTFVSNLLLFLDNQSFKDATAGFPRHG